AGLPVRLPGVRRAARGAAELHRRPAHRVPRLQRSVAQGAHGGGSGVQGVGFLPHRQPSRRQRWLGQAGLRQRRWHVAGFGRLLVGDGWLVVLRRRRVDRIARRQGQPVLRARLDRLGRRGDARTEKGKTQRRRRL
ncbi:MAG: hypothetical protein AVDCRST_MAG21-957, partial [uncultured Nocardioidaceae bacterium]